MKNKVFISVLTVFILMMVCTISQTLAQNNLTENEESDGTVKEESEMIKVENMALDPALPVSVIGTKMDGQVNFMTCSWFTRLEVDPYLFYICRVKLFGRA